LLIYFFVNQFYGMLFLCFREIKSPGVKAVQDVKGIKSHSLHCHASQWEISLPFSRDDHLSRLVPAILKSLRKLGDIDS